MLSPVSVPYVDKYDLTGVWPADVPFPRSIEAGEVRFDMDVRYPWGVMRGLRGLAVEKATDGLRVWGWRTLMRPRESGYVYEGCVSVGGETRRAFTSSQLFMISGKLVNVAVLYVCAKGEPVQDGPQ